MGNSNGDGDRQWPQARVRVNWIICLKNWHNTTRIKFPHCHGTTLNPYAPCFHTHSEVRWWRAIIESRNGFENWSTKKFTNHHKKITGIPTENSDVNLNHEKNWHKTTRKKLPHCPGSMLSSPCSMLMFHGHIWKNHTHSNVPWQRVIVESRNGFENW